MRIEVDMQALQALQRRIEEDASTWEMMRMRIGMRIRSKEERG